MTTGTGAAFDRALDFQRETLARVGTERRTIPEGWVVKTPSLPLVWSLNHVEVTRPLQVTGAVALAERHSGDLGHRQLVVHGRDGERLAAGLRTRGWRVERDVVMSLRDQPDRALDTSAVVEAPEPEALELMRAWIGEGEEMRESPETHEQSVECCRRIWRARNTRRFGVLGHDGALAGITMLFSDAPVAQVEDVYVVPSERGKGLGRMLVTHAVVQAVDAGHEFVFIVADDEGWPKHLYGSVGFEPAGVTWVFDRRA
jgi:GNAT superfamily N-acetyltransferase